MERILSPESNRGESAAAACVGCHAEATEPRCAHCGAAVRAGAFRVERLIAQGPHSRVYLAEDAGGRKVALKELTFSLVPGTEQLDAFEREAAILRQLDHPRVPALVASFSEGRGVHTRLYLAQQFIAGESLLQRLGRGPVGEEEAWRIAEEVLELLVALHGRSPAVLHRDIKPANLILRPDGAVCLVDFGAVRHVANGVTHGSTLVGTFGYMPPEQLGGTVDASSDLYALGATLVHALTGVQPSELLSDGMTLEVQGRVPGSPLLIAFIQRLVAARRGARFPSAEAALDAARERHRGAAGTTAEGRQRGRTRGKSRSRTRRWRQAAAFAAVFALAWLGLELWSAPAAAPPLFPSGGGDGAPAFVPSTPPSTPAPALPAGGPHRNFRTPWPSQERNE